MRLRSLALVALALLPLTASAELMGTAGSVGQTAFTVSVNPQYPAPYSQATLSFLSSTLNLANATLLVSVAGKTVYQGGVQPVSLALGKAGIPTTATATVTTNGTKYSQTITIQPQDVVLIAEPISSAPPLYPGKPLVPLEGNVRVVAVANLRDSKGKALDPASLSYTWSVDGTTIANASGIGKQALLVTAPLQYRGRDVSVAVTSQNGGLVGGASLSLSSVAPTVRIYENDPLLGIRFDRALIGSYTIGSVESTLYGAAFSLPTSSGAPLLEWFLNGAAAQTGPSITLRPTGSGGGDASLSLTASAGSYSTATANLSLIFGATKSSNFFGL